MHSSIIIIMAIMLHDMHTQNTPVKCAGRTSIYSEDECVNTYYNITSLYTVQWNVCSFCWNIYFVKFIRSPHPLCNCEYKKNNLIFGNKIRW